MANEPGTTGRPPQITKLFSIDLLKLPIIGPWLCRLLGGGIGPKKDSEKQNTKGGKYGH